MLFPYHSFLQRAASVLLVVVTACHGPSDTRSHQPVPAERYFTGNPALPVAQACQHDDPDGVVNALQQTHVSPNAEGEQGLSLLLLAMFNRSERAMLALLTHGADPNLTTMLGRHPSPTQPVAFVAAGDSPTMLRLLLDHGGDPNSRYDGQSALVCAAEAQRQEHVRLLVARGADVNVLYTSNGLREANDIFAQPLVVHLAAMRDFESLVTLLEHGADVHTPSKMGRTVAFELQEKGSEYKPGDRWYPWVVKAKHLLEAQGIRFPVVDPAIVRATHERTEDAQRRQWECTPEGQHLLALIHAVQRARELRQTSGEDEARLRLMSEQAEEVFQAWRKDQPGWVPSVNYVPEYQDPPTSASEDMDMTQRHVRFAADSARWAEWAKAVH